MQKELDRVLWRMPTNELGPGSSAIHWLQSLTKENFQDALPIHEDNAEEWLCVGIKCLECVVQQCFTGPPLPADSDGSTPPFSGISQHPYLVDLHIDPVLFEKMWLEMDIPGGGGAADDPYGKQIAPGVSYLWLAQRVFVGLPVPQTDIHVSPLATHFPSANWWAFRTLLINQLIYIDLVRSSSIKRHIEVFVKNLIAAYPFLKFLDTSDNMLQENMQETQKEIAGVFAVELSKFYAMFSDTDKAIKYLEAAMQLSNLHVSFKGALGKRTRYQSKLVAQLLLDVKQCTSERPDGASFVPISRHPASTASELPKDVANQDDTVLNSIAVNEAHDGQPQDLSNFDQVLILNLFGILKRSGPQDILLKEQLRAYIDLLLKNPLDWIVLRMTLFARSQLECDAKRFVERALSQSESLVQEFSATNPNFENRFTVTAFLTGLLPNFRFEKQLGDLLISLGCTREALSVYERLQLWDEVIRCYRSLGRLERAESLIRERLEAKRTPTLLTYLGDVTLNPAHYEEAWELSHHRYAAAQKGLAMFHLNRKSYQPALDALTHVTHLTPFDANPWYNLGYCALQLELWPLAARSYHRYCSIETESAEAWANLAVCYVKAGRKRKAAAMLREALRFDYENWRLWENALLLFADTGHLADAVKAYHRLIDLKGSWEDAECLNILVDAAAAKQKKELDSEKQDVNEPILNGDTDALQRATELEDLKGLDFGSDDDDDDDAETVPGRDFHVSDETVKSSKELITDLKQLLGRVTSSIPGNGAVWYAYARLVRLELLNSADGGAAWDKFLRVHSKAVTVYLQKQNWISADTLQKQVIDCSVSLAQACCAALDAEVATGCKQALVAAKFPLRNVVAALKKHFGENMETGMLNCKSLVDQYTMLNKCISRL